MSDILTRLKIDTTSFDKGLSKSKQEVKAFEKTGAALTSGLKVFAGAVGAGVTALEVFNKAIKSSQMLEDKYNEVMTEAKAVTDNFFYSLSNFDFTPFASGMSTIIQLAKDAAQAFDQLGNTQISFDFLSNINMADFEEQVAAIRDPSASGASKKGAFTSAADIVKKQKEYASQLASQISDTFNKEIRKDSGAPKMSFSNDDIRKVMSIDVGSDPAAAREKVMKDYKKYQAEIAKLYGKHTTTTTSSSNWGTMTNVAVDYKSINAARGQIDNAYKNTILSYTMLNRWTDDKLKEMTQMLNRSDSARRTAASMEKTLNRASKTANGGGTAKAVKTETNYVEGSIADLDKQLSAWRKKFNEASDLAGRTAANDMINSIESKKIRIQVELVTNGNVAPLLGISEGGGKTVAGKNPNEDIKSMSGEAIAIDTTSYQTATGDVTSLDTALTQLSSSFGAMSGMVSGGAANWLQWGANAVKAIAQTIPMIVALTGATTAEATANATAGAAAAGKSVAAIPVVGAVMAVAAIASFIAAMAAVPKFATGGVVGGSSKYGDNLLARVNSGEVILNEAQQKNISAKLSGKTAKIEVGGKFEMDGRDLIAVISKNERRYDRT